MGVEAKAKAKETEGTGRGGDRKERGQEVQATRRTGESERLYLLKACYQTRRDTVLDTI